MTKLSGSTCCYYQWLLVAPISICAVVAWIPNLRFQAFLLGLQRRGCIVESILTMVRGSRLRVFVDLVLAAHCCRHRGRQSRCYRCHWRRCLGQGVSSGGSGRCLLYLLFVGVI